TTVRPSVQADPQSQSTVTVPEGFQAVAAKLLPWWAEATPEQQQLVLEDMALAHQADALSPEDYCADPMPLAEHMATVLEERQRRGLTLPQAQPQEPAAAPQAEPKPTEQQQRADVDAKAQKRVESQAKDIAERWQKYDVRQTSGLVDLGKRCDE